MSVRGRTPRESTWNRRNGALSTPRALAAEGDSEIGRVGVGAAQQDRDPFAAFRRVCAGGQRRERRRGAVLDHDPVLVPEAPASVDQVFVAYEDRLHTRARGDGVGDIADPPRAQRVGGDPGYGDVNRAAARERGVEGRARRRLHPNDLRRSLAAAAMPAINPPPPTAT